MRILVIGGTQFMGPHVVRQLLEDGHEVTVLHRGAAEPEPDGSTHIHGDRREPGVVANAIGSACPEVVVDMVAMLEPDAAALAEAAAGRVRRVVVASSIDVYRAYGRLHGTEPGPAEPTPLTEDSPLREKRYPYRADPPRPPDAPDRWMDDYDKIPVEQTLLAAVGFATTVLRLPMVYGPGDPQHRLFPYLKRMDDGRDAIPLGETFAAWRTSRGYVENVAAAVVLAALDDRPGNAVYNVAEDLDETEAEWVAAIGRAAGWDGEVAVVPDEALTNQLGGADAHHHLFARSSRIRRELGYREPIGRDESLDRTVAWARANPPSGPLGGLFDYAAEDAAMQAARG